MFSFFKKKREKRVSPKLRVDLHSHLIPGIDDGSQNMEESLSLIAKMEKLGYEKLITTPHIMADAYKNTPIIIEEGLEALREAVQKEGIEIEIEAGAEYYLDDGFVELLRKGDIMSIDEKYLLFETSYVSKPLRTEEIIFEIASAGYIPLMAHPERYRYIKDPIKEYGRFKELGVLFQVNLNSLTGQYGKSAMHLAEILSKNGMIDFLGSDAHHEKHVGNLERVFDSDAYGDLYAYNTILNNTLM